MSDGVFISDRPQLAIARQTVSFASLGLNDPTLTRIIYEVGNPYLSYVPTDEFNPISGITEGKSYLLYLNSFFDGSPALANAVLDNLIPQTTTNVFADERVVFLCTSSVSFTTAGITTSNTRLITLVSEGYFTSYDPNDSINGIDGFVEGELYDIDPITDIDLHLYGVTKIRYSDEVLYLDSLEDVVVTNTNPTATLPLTEDETLVRNPITGIWENEPVRVKFVDDEASLPATGIENIVYVAKSEKTSWYWDGSAYQQIGGGTGGGSQDLQSVTDIGNTTTNDIKIIDGELKVFDTAGAAFDYGDFAIQSNRNVCLNGPFNIIGGLVRFGEYGAGDHLGTATYVAGFNSFGNVVEIAASTLGGTYTDEQAQDAVGTILSSEFTYDDATPQISINQIDYSKLTGTPSIPTQYTDEMAQDATAAMIAAGTHTGIIFTYDDTGNKISAAVTGGTETDPLSVHLTGTSTATGDMTLDLGTTNEFNVTGNQANNTIVNITNSNATNSSAIKGISSGSGQGFTGVSSSGIGASGTSTSNTGVAGTSTSAKGVHGKSTSNYGVYAQTNTGIALLASNFSSTTNASDEMLRIDRGSSGTAANGIGGYISYFIKSTDGFGYEAARIGGVWSNATTVNRTGQLEFFTTTSGAASATKKMTLKGDGTLNITVVEFADNAAAIAGGLAVGDIYRTGDLLKIVH